MVINSAIKRLLQGWLTLVLLGGCGWLDEPIVKTTVSDGQVLVADSARVDGVEAVAQFELVYYWTVLESDYPGEKTAILYSVFEEQLAVVSQSFAAELTVEGTGVLEDGRMLGLDVPCDFSTTEWCYKELDAQTYPYGKGTGGALMPFRTVALAGFWEAEEGSVWYVKALDGLTIPGVEGSVTHDGCVVVGDTGWSLGQLQMDLFIYRESYFLVVEVQLPSETMVTAYRDSTRCPENPNNIGQFWPL